MWFNCLKGTEPLRGDTSLIFTSPGVPSTHFVNLERMKAESTWEPLTGFEHGNPYWESSTLTTRLLLQFSGSTKKCDHD